MSCIQHKKELLDFCRRNKKIICYGAGRYGRIVRYYLYENGIKIVSFAETIVRRHRIVLGLEVVKINDIAYDSDIGIIICANNSVQHDMENTIQSISNVDYIVLDERLIQELDKKNAYDKRFEEPGRKHILMYHRVVDINNDLWNISVGPQVFEKHMKYIVENYDVVKVEDIDYFDDKEQLAVTFDDGYCDFYDNAFPVLEKYKVPATVYVTTGKIEKKSEFWWDVITKCILDNPQCPDVILFKGDIMDISSPASKRKACWSIREKLLEMDIEEINTSLSELRRVTKDSGEVRKDYMAMSLDELKEIDDSKYIDIGGHTINHCRLASLGDERKKEEIHGSKRYLEKILNHKINSFSFPFGCELDYDKKDIMYSLEAEYSSVLAVKTKYYDSGLYEYNYDRVAVEEIDGDNEREIRRTLALS